LIIELYEPGFGVKKFGGFDDLQSFLGCFWNDLQIHIKAEIEITNNSSFLPSIFSSANKEQLAGKIF
jgi:hypothetical protein